MAERAQLLAYSCAFYNGVAFLFLVIAISTSNWATLDTKISPPYSTFGFQTSVRVGLFDASIDMEKQAPMDIKYKDCKDLDTEYNCKDLYLLSTSVVVVQAISAVICILLVVPAVLLGLGKIGRQASMALASGGTVVFIVLFLSIAIWKHFVYDEGMASINERLTEKTGFSWDKATYPSLGYSFVLSFLGTILSGLSAVVGYILLKQYPSDYAASQPLLGVQSL